MHAQLRFGSCQELGYTRVGVVHSWCTGQEEDFWDDQSVALVLIVPYWLVVLLKCEDVHVHATPK